MKNFFAILMVMSAFAVSSVMAQDAPPADAGAPMGEPAAAAAPAKAKKEHGGKHHGGAKHKKGHGKK